MKKLLSTLLSVMLVACMMPTIAFAEGVEPAELTNLRAALKAGGEVQLTGDIIVPADSNTIEVPDGVTVTLDLNGFTISQTKAQTNSYQMILNDGNLTIKDRVGTGKISYTDSGNGGEYISDTIYNRGELVIDGGTIENLSSTTVASNGYPHAVDTYSGLRDTSVTINGGTIYCVNYSAIRMFCVNATNKANLTINDGATVKGAVDMQNGTLNAANGSLIINGGTFETSANANNIRFANWNGGATAYGITAAVNGGSFDGGISTAYVPAEANFNSKFITGGTFASDVSTYVADTYIAEADTNGKYNVVQGIGQNGKAYIAEVDGTQYISLQDAVNDADGKTVTMIGNAILEDTLTIPVGKTVTLDLNGKTLSITNREAKGSCAIENKGSLTIKNGTVTYTSTQPDPNYGYGTNTINNSGNLVIDGATIVNTTDGGSSNAIDNAPGSALVVNSGTIQSEKVTIRLRDGSTATINDGAISGARAVQIHLFQGVDADTKLTINGGTFAGDYALYSYAYGDVTFAKTTIDINGGIFNGIVAFGGGNKAATEDVTITGGTFEEVYSYNDDMGKFITGGVYSADVTNYVVKDTNTYVMNDNYYVGEASKPAAPSGKVWADDDKDGVYELKTVSTPSTGGGYVSIEKPSITVDDGATADLSIPGTTLKITVKDGYELVDVTLNGISKGAVSELKGLKTGDKVVIITKAIDETTVTDPEVELIARSEMSKAKGKKAIKVYWFAEDGSELTYDGYEIFRSVKRYSGYGKKPIFETEREAYWNTAIKSGNKYYYKVRGYVTVDGVKYYTDWSKKAWRTVE